MRMKHLLSQQILNAGNVELNWLKKISQNGGPVLGSILH